jgi:UDP-N-acetylmuramate--alanine ligase
MSRGIPFDLGPVHIVGIGGIGMSAIAEVMLTLGYTVQGSDARAGANTERLARQGVRIMIGHAADNIAGAGAVVISSAIKAGNPELDEARRRGLPVVPRADMLAELMRQKWSVAIAGTHGKTTTTTMIATLLDAAKIDPTVIGGGIMAAYGSNAKVGRGDWMVVEADESDGTFTKLRPTIGVVTNIDPEHLDYWKDFDALKKGFEDFVHAIPFYGYGVMCLDHEEVQKLVERVRDRRLITYGFNPQADVRATNLRLDADGARYDVTLRGRDGSLDEMRDVRLAMPGAHNVQNSLAAIAVASALGAGATAIRGALAKFGGVKRRFTTTGVWNGVRIIDDYAHHPKEIAAVLAAARGVTGDHGRVIAVVQPHRFSRLNDLFSDFSTCFNDADAVLVADVYPAGEAPIPGVDAPALAASLARHGHRNARYLASLEDLPAEAAKIARAGDLVVLLGAGDITAHANALPSRLEALA